MYFFQLRDLADAVMEHGWESMLESLWQSWSPNWPAQAEDLAQMKAVFSKPGVMEAALAYYRAPFQADHPRAAETGQLWSNLIPAAVLGLTGTMDGCVSAPVFRASMAPSYFTRTPTLREFEGLGHFLHLEAPEIIPCSAGAEPRIP